MLLIILPSVLVFTTVNSYGFMSNPPARNKVAGRNNSYCPQCGNSVGAATRIHAKGAPFPDNHDAEGTHGLCGDPWEGSYSGLLPLNQQTFMKEGPIVATYSRGQTIEIEISRTAHLWGHFEFRICEGGLSGEKYSTQKAGQDCLNKNLLVRPDPKTHPECRNARAIDASNYDCQPLDAAHPERWYLPPRSYATDGMNYKMKFKLPDNLTCNPCTMQWNWITGNSCLVKGYKEYFANFKKEYPSLDPSWDQSNSHKDSCDEARYRQQLGQQFWNCADIKIA
ncbi:hypothetical protein FOZ60_010220 [Perkinsus olseni]|uniref:Chitin-binding type-4 domain-containing protein n=1 Tax=Perkinsus olseni TaxID=32597 RepID=A0A7J6NGX3_PEROL|nr:hypothetical protein FOZ60_010220 [Perkinsus olseni]KAF4750316.1 hypothetical protein FOZ62_028509 [Perkinsus olseni]